MLTKNINFKNFIIKSNTLKVKKDFDKLLEQNLGIINSLKPSYKYNFLKKFVLKFKKFVNIRIIGMGGSVLGAKAIYQFLKNKINKNFSFIDNLKIKLYNTNKKKNF